MEKSMIVHKLNENTDKVIKLFEAEYTGVKLGKAIFTGHGGYVDKIGPYDLVYRFDFPDREELKEFIEDLIELYNSSEGE
jgi:hypothetical protein